MRSTDQDYLDRFQADVLADAINQAAPSFWDRRAGQFAAVGNPRCDEIARACRNHAHLLRRWPLLSQEAVDALTQSVAEVAA